MGGIPTALKGRNSTKIWHQHIGNCFSLVRSRKLITSTGFFTQRVSTSSGKKSVSQVRSCDFGLFSGLGAHSFGTLAPAPDTLFGHPFRTLFRTHFGLPFGLPWSSFPWCLGKDQGTPPQTPRIFYPLGTQKNTRKTEKNGLKQAPRN